jgi:hypothetical protein
MEPAREQFFGLLRPIVGYGMKKTGKLGRGGAVAAGNFYHAGSYRL